jgi:hypothetical protein
LPICLLEETVPSYAGCSAVGVELVGLHCGYKQKRL